MTAWLRLGVGSSSEERTWGAERGNGRVHIKGGLWFPLPPDGKELSTSTNSVDTCHLQDGMGGEASSDTFPQNTDVDEFEERDWGKETCHLLKLESERETDECGPRHVRRLGGWEIMGVHG